MTRFKRTPLLTALAAATLMVLITIVLPIYFKTWFVQETGNLRILPAIGPILAIGLLLRWPVRKIALLFFAFGCCVSLFSLVYAEAPFQAGYALLVALHAFLLWILMSESLKQYVNNQKSLVTI